MIINLIKIYICGDYFINFNYRYFTKILNILKQK